MPPSQDVFVQEDRKLYASGLMVRITVRYELDIGIAENRTKANFATLMLPCVVGAGLRFMD
jgi:hypothetical protein